MPPPPRRSRAARARRLSVTEFAILGMISMTTDADTPIHGYDLARQLSDGPVATIIRIESGMLYHYLKKLGRGGLVTSTVESQVGRPDRHLHALTPDGEHLFHAWLREPVTATREMRIDFLLKLWFAWQQDLDLARTLVADQRGVLQSLSASLEMQQQESSHTPDSTGFEDHAFALRRSQNDAALAWLDRITAALQET